MADPHAAAAAAHEAAAHGAAAAHEGFLQNPHIWVAVAFIIFVALVWKIAKKAVITALDGRAAQLRKQLDDAAKLKAEAEQVLATAQAQHKAAVAEAGEIIAHAKETAQRLAVRAEEESVRALKRREEAALEKIAQAEHAALAEVRGLAVDRAVVATRRLLTDAANAGLGPKLLEDAIADLPNRLH